MISTILLFLLGNTEIVTDKVTDLAVADIKIDEGLRLHKYKCHISKNTLIGYGKNITVSPLYNIDHSEAYFSIILKKDVDFYNNRLKIIFPSYEVFPNSVKVALINLIYNVGERKFLTFKKFIICCNKFQFSDAGNILKRSKWYTQVGKKRKNRTVSLIKQAGNMKKVDNESSYVSY